MALELAARESLLSAEEVAFTTEVAAREPAVVPLPDGLHARLRVALAERGLDRLYAHQAAAFEAAERGENVIVSTGTASG